MSRPEPFQRLVDEHGAAIFGVLRAMLGPQDAEDCLQETYLAALRVYGDEPVEHPRAWLLTIARRRAIDRIRAEGRRPTVPLDSETTDEWGPPVTPPEAPDPDLWRAVAALPERRRLAIVLRFIADLDHRGIAAVMGGTEAAARRNVADGLSSLRESLRAS